MDDIRAVVRRALRRIAFNRTTRVAARALIGVAAVAVLAVLADRLLYVGEGVWYLVMAAACVAAAAAVPVAVRRWPREPATAIEVDQRLCLAERLSTALAVSGSESPMARAVLADARSYARGVPVARTFPLQPHREYLVLGGLLAAALAIGAWMPQYDLLARRKAILLAEQERKEVRAEAKQLKREVARLRRRAGEKTLKRAEIHLGKMDEVIQKMEAGSIKRAEAMAELDELAKSLNEAQRKMGRKGGLRRRSLADKQGLDRTRKLAESLAAKDFGAVTAELNKLDEEAALKQLNREQQRELSRELNKLADSLQQQDQELADVLRKSASSLEQGDLDEYSKALQQCQFQVDERAKLEEDLKLLQKMQGLCRNGRQGLSKRVVKANVPGLYTEGESRKRGPGMGGPGIGEAGVAPEEKHEVAFEPRGIRGQIRDGRVVGSWFIDGKQVKGEAKVEYADEVKAAADEAAQAMQQDKIPRAYEEYVRDYFQGMKGP